MQTNYTKLYPLPLPLPPKNVWKIYTPHPHNLAKLPSEVGEN